MVGDRLLRLSGRTVADGFVHVHVLREGAAAARREVGFWRPRQLVCVGLDGRCDLGVGTRGKVGRDWSRCGNVLDVRQFLGLVRANGLYIFPRRHGTWLCVETCPTLRKVFFKQYLARAQW
jgi:hypothetical protein